MKKYFVEALLAIGATATFAQVNTAQQSGTQATTDTAAVNFVSKAKKANMMEIKTGKMAQEKASDQDVKQFASKMIQDHTAASQELMQVLQNKKIDTTAHRMDMGAAKDDHMDKLQAASGKEFDKEYMTLQLKGHMKNIALFEAASKNVKDPDLRAFATKNLPVLRDHLKMAQAIAQKLNISVPSGTGSPGMQH